MNYGQLALIFTLSFAYITMNTIRTLLEMKGYKLWASLLSIAEIVTYVVGLSLVLSKLNNVWNIAAYALGYGAGIYFGTWLEDRLRLGLLNVNVILPKTDESKKFAENIRDEGYGVTVKNAQGREGARLEFEILTPRKREQHLYNFIEANNPDAFIISYEPKFIKGGFWRKNLRKRVQKQNRNIE
ncbi:DUF2179 domain-containing protein [Pediococcus inopinatus]|uniref:UPF0316 protein N6G96_02825 n=1 Tax=Pediococcus inopinatus TaxID=114090 RepID=A0ABZ0Q7T0_9LACO|nr:DUF2179 domain-containing protein [Pediococcus inopinatus]AVK99419.1 DUF2179 domain-containing protein [Pediococcus inopinatus]WPC17190.1 DUF2179 domain-containing protein [Pediococcus inopinatus]WPC20465.1 DUF2179 domain-containing protein [Pediococcus inopinatus]WPC22170.1 DUF2179 domain-containing protein [Pediococcus inopinatus]WPP08899.1 DUF2179 domain-containing protein [Pediococcus inopinatus]